MDERIADALLLLPTNSFERGLIGGITDKSVIDAFRKRIKHIEITDLERLGSVKKNTFDFILLLFNVPPEQKVLKDAIDAASPEGAVMAVMPSGLFRPAGTGENFPMRFMYGVSPSVEDVRLILPVENRSCAAASLALYQPSLARARLRKFAAYWFARFGLSTLWSSWLMCVTYKERPPVAKGLHASLRNCFGEDARLALFTGTPGYLRKPTIQVMDPSGSILGYCKVGDSLQTRAVVENEANIMRFIAGLDLGDAIVPDVILSGESGDGIMVLVESTRKKHLSSAPLRPEAMHNEFLVKLFEGTKTQQGFREAPVYREITTRVSDLDGYADGEPLRDLVNAFEWSSAVIENERIPLCLAHRDFTPWNTFLADGRLYVFDWEFGRDSWVPLSDAFHFVLQKGILVDHAEEDSLWGKLIGNGSKEGSFLKTLGMHIGISEAAYHALVALYLIDMITTYLLHYKGYGHTPIDGKELLARWRGLLGRVMKTRGSSLP